MKIRMFFVLAIVMGGHLCAQSQPLKEWTFLVYMVPNGGVLEEWADNNIESMRVAKASDQIGICVQRQDFSGTAKRMTIANNAYESDILVKLETDTAINIFNAMQWAMQKAPAKKYGVVLWGHGFGAHEPIWSIEKYDWEPQADQASSSECINGACDIRCLPCFSQPVTRGILFDDQVKTFLTNQALGDLVNRISIQLLGGDTLALVGTDACRMAMIEVAYPLRGSVDYLLGSQNCELPDGWDYQGLFDALAQNPTQSTLQCVQAITNSYKAYYQQHTYQDIYTLSAIKLASIDSLVAQLNTMINAVVALDDDQARQLIAVAHQQALPFGAVPGFSDLVSICRALSNEVVNGSYDQAGAAIIAAAANNIIQLLASDMIVANVTGTNVTGARGLSIHFPSYVIDRNYTQSPFVRETLWQALLEKGGAQLG
jgi:hypothetical protein